MRDERGWWSFVTFYKKSLDLWSNFIHVLGSSSKCCIIWPDQVLSFRFVPVPPKFCSEQRVHRTILINDLTVWQFGIVNIRCNTMRSWCLFNCQSKIGWPEYATGCYIQYPILNSIASVMRGLIEWFSDMNTNENFGISVLTMPTGLLMRR